MLRYYTIVILLCAVSFALARKTNKEAFMEHMHRTSSDQECKDVFRTCRGIPKCKRALRKLRTNCSEVRKNKCKEEKDILICKNVMDTIFAHVFPEKPCLCNQLSKKCARMRNLAYANPCFTDIRLFLHKREEKKFQPAKGNNTRTEIEENKNESARSDVPSADDDLAKLDAKDSVIGQMEEEYEEIFGDGGFQKTRPTSRLTLTFDETQGGSHSTTATSTSTPAETTVAIKIETDKTTSTKSQLDRLREQLGVDEDVITTDMKYRIVSIVIGSLFLFAIFAGVVCLAARKIYRSSMLYKRGKIIDQQQKRDASVLS